MSRDKIEFSYVKSQLEDYMTTLIFINGTDLKSIIGNIEKRQCAKEGFCMRQGGCYEGICFFIAFHYQNHFLLRTLDDYIYDGQRFTLYDYRYTGIPGDHSLTCKISIGKDEVIWHDFKNYSKISPIEFDYGKLKFCFGINQYFDAISAARMNTLEGNFS
jgi:hypothetical protein